MTDQKPASSDLATIDHVLVAVSAKRKAYVNIVLPLFITSIIAYLDRVNLSYVALTMRKDLGFSEQVLEHSDSRLLSAVRSDCVYHFCPGCPRRKVCLAKSMKIEAAVECVSFPGVEP